MFNGIGTVGTPTSQHTIFDFMVARLMSDVTKLSAALERVRSYSDVRVLDMALSTGISRSTLYKHLSKSNGSIPIHDFVLICEALGIDLAVVPDRDIDTGDDPDFLLMLVTTLLSDVGRIGQNLNLMRRYFGMKTHEIAECSGLSNSTICKYMRGATERLPIRSVVRVLSCMGYVIKAYPAPDDRAKVER